MTHTPNTHTHTLYPCSLTFCYIQQEPEERKKKEIPRTTEVALLLRTDVSRKKRKTRICVLLFIPRICSSDAKNNGASPCVVILNVSGTDSHGTTARAKDDCAIAALCVGVIWWIHSVHAIQPKLLTICMLL